MTSRTKLSPEADGVGHLADYQIRLLNSLEELIAVNFFRRKPEIRILDAGCDPSGRQARHLAQMICGEVHGVNPIDGFPSSDAEKEAGPRTILRNMDGMALEYSDNYFDLVISGNVMEHVPDPSRYIAECARVLKPSGFAYFECDPVWTGPRGHHIHEDMISENCPSETNYRNDGSIIPDWGHLVLDEPQLKNHLHSKLLPETSRYIRNYLFRTDDLNQTGWRQIETALRISFPYLQLSPWSCSNSHSALRPTDEADQYDISGFRAVARLKRWNPIARRLIWRLRRMGL